MLNNNEVAMHEDITLIDSRTTSRCDLDLLLETREESEMSALVVMPLHSLL